VHKKFSFFSLFGLFFSCILMAEKTEPVLINARIKTDDIGESGDAADDPAIYINQKDPAKSLVIGTNKKSGLRVYDMAGHLVQSLNDGAMNNVDLRDRVIIHGKKETLIAAGNRSTNSMDFYIVNKSSNRLQALSLGKHNAGIEIYGSCLYTNTRSKKTYFFGTSKSGEVAQWEILSSGAGLFELKRVRDLRLSSQVEGCVADDHYAYLYVGEEDVGIWRFGAEPDDQSAPLLIDSTNEQGHLVADVEGLAIYQSAHHGYLLASSQGENAYNIYSRKNAAYIGKFQLMFNNKLLEDTDGIAITSNFINRQFPFGLMVAQDGSRQNAFQSFKYVSWTDIAFSFFPPLDLNLSADER
jgi:3-phytase